MARLVITTSLSPDATAGITRVTFGVSVLSETALSLPAGTARGTLGSSRFTWSSAAVELSSGGSAALATFTEVITHPTDGSAVTVSYSVRHPLISSVASGSVTAPALDRASSFVFCSRSVPIDGEHCFRAVVSSVSPDFYHRITLFFGDYSVSSGSFAGFADVTIPAEWAAHMTSECSDASAQLVTYSNSTLSHTVGSVKSCDFKLLLPHNARPTVPLGFAEAQPYFPDGLSCDDFLEGFYAKIAFDITGVSFPDGAEFSSFTLDGVDVGSEVNLPLRKSGRIVIYTGVRDSRGRIGERALPIDVEPYSPPRLVAPSAYRCDIAGNANPSGLYIRLFADAEVCDYGSAVLIATRRIRSGDGSSELQTVLVPGEEAIVSAPASAFEVVITLGDGIKTVEWKRKIASTAPSLHLRKGGGAAFGKYAETASLLDVAWDLQIGGECRLSSPLAVSYGGSGASTPAEARANLSVPSSIAIDLSEALAPTSVSLSLTGSAGAILLAGSEGSSPFCQFIAIGTAGAAVRDLLGSSPLIPLYSAGNLALTLSPGAYSALCFGNISAELSI